MRRLFCFVIILAYIFVCSSYAEQNRGQIVFYSTRDGHHEIYVMNADGSNQRRLANHPAGEYCPSWTSGGTENLKKTPQTIDELRTRIDSIFEETNISGAAVAIISTDSIIWIGTFGFANLETKEKVTENTHFLHRLLHQEFHRAWLSKASG